MYTCTVNFYKIMKAHDSPQAFLDPRIRILVYNLINLANLGKSLNLLAYVTLIIMYSGQSSIQRDILTF